MSDNVFNGFNLPRENWSKLPHDLIDAFPIFSSQGEVLVVLYILRHTWGYHESEKRITLDEFQHGRKRADGSRIDNGVGMAETSIIRGLAKANEHGFINIEIDDSDKGRIKKYYSLNMTSSESLDLTKRIASSVQANRKSVQRKKPMKETLETTKDSVATLPPADSAPDTQPFKEKRKENPPPIPPAPPNGENLESKKEAGLHEQFKNALIAYGFGVDPQDKGKAKPYAMKIAPIAAWLEGKEKPINPKAKGADVLIPGCNPPASVNEVIQFCTEWKDKGLDLPQTVGAFSPNFYTWRKEKAGGGKKGGNGYHKGHITLTQLLERKDNKIQYDILTRSELENLPDAPARFISGVTKRIEGGRVMASVQNLQIWYKQYLDVLSKESENG